MGLTESESVPVGYRFHPNDEEIVNYYLKLKMQGHESLVKAIAEVEVCKWEPWDLPKMSIMKSEDQVWYFFSPRDLKYAKSPRFKRMTKAGFWKATGKDRKVKTRKRKELIGTKKTLVFHRGRVPNGVRTNWVMHEYHPLTIPTGQRAFVLCVLKKKPDEIEIAACNETDLNRDVTSGFQNQVTEDPIPDFGDCDADLESLIRSTISPLDYDISSTLQPQMNTGQGPPYMESSFADNFYSSRLQSNLGTHGEEEEDASEFLNTVLVDQDVYCFKELQANFRHPQSLMSLGVENIGISSDTDAETSQAQHYHVPGATSRSHESARSKEFQMMRMVHAPGRVVSTSNCDLHIKESNNFRVDEFGGDDMSSVDSDTNNIHEINCLFLESEEETVNARISNSSFQPKSRNIISPVAPRNTQLPGRSPYKALYERDTIKHVSASDMQQQKSIIESVKDICPESSVKLCMKQRENGSLCSMDRKSSFFLLETPRFSRMSNPPSVYLVNTLIGSFLFIVIIWEVFLQGAQW